MSIQDTLTIKRIRVWKLFSQYDYCLVSPEASDGIGKVFILYGDNGSGKTTILKLAFHLLAPEDNEGHKTRVAPIPFKKFQIEFSDETRVTAERRDGPQAGSFSMRIERPHAKTVSTEFQADEQFIVNARPGTNYETVLQALRSLGVSLYMLTDDRQIHYAGRRIEGSIHSLERDASDTIALRDGERFV